MNAAILAHTDPRLPHKQAIERNGKTHMETAAKRSRGIVEADY